MYSRLHQRQCQYGLAKVATVGYDSSAFVADRAFGEPALRARLAGGRNLVSGTPMQRLTVVAVTIAGLVVCPAVCWMHALGGCAQARRVAGGDAAASPGAAPDGRCDCCCSGQRRPAPAAPLPGNPCRAPGGDCICKGGTLVTKLDAGQHFAPVAVTLWLPAAIDPAAATTPLERWTDAPHPTANGPPSGRAVRILLQSFLA
jgi:hypothetical protein